MQELQVNKENCFSVLMAVYKKEQPLFFKEALRSVFEQSLIPNEVVLVKDGPLTEELEQIIVSFSAFLFGGDEGAQNPNLRGLAAYSVK